MLYIVVDMEKLKTPKQIERHLKGVANHRRIAILFLIAEGGAPTLDEITTRLNANEKTIGEHTRRLHTAGLIDKKYRGKFVEHTLSPYGKVFVRFLKSFQQT
jgi:predicted transcriptional regulator